MSSDKICRFEVARSKVARVYCGPCCAILTMNRGERDNDECVESVCWTRPCIVAKGCRRHYRVSRWSVTSIILWSLPHTHSLPRHVVLSYCCFRRWYRCCDKVGSPSVNGTEAAWIRSAILLFDAKTWVYTGRAIYHIVLLVSMHISHYGH